MVAVASVAFLLLALLIAGSIIGLALLRRVKQREKSKDKKGKRVESIECTEKREELPGEESVACDDSEQWADKAALHYEQHVEDLHYESTDVLGQGCRGRVEGSGIRSEGDDVTDAAAVLMEDGVGHGMMEKGQQNDQPKDTPDAVYAVVDKSKKKKQGKTQGGASTATTQGIYTEDYSSAFGLDWVGNVAGKKPEESHDEVRQGIPSNDDQETGLQYEPCSPIAVYAVVEKSKKRNKGNTDGVTRLTSTATDEIEVK